MADRLNPYNIHNDFLGILALQLSNTNNSIAESEEPSDINSNVEYDLWLQSGHINDY